MHRECGAHSIYATFAKLKFAPTFKIRPYKLGRRPLQGLRPGAMAPLPPPPRYATERAFPREEKIHQKRPTVHKERFNRQSEPFTRENSSRKDNSEKKIHPTRQAIHKRRYVGQSEPFTRDLQEKIHQTKWTIHNRRLIKQRAFPKEDPSD